ncbi:glycosyltransferase family 8 protein [Pectinatus haikarae]|uniref:glycosyltransferase family 8 protein n=1 Tax=Pectinatus haikarae TaxID=349096 RepID=UPI0018C54EA8|nr:glycosyltransferase family 8 protein [Pectinatus haikarae]
MKIIRIWKSDTMFENAVKQKNFIQCSKDFSSRKADLHIAFGISADFTYPVGILMTSLLENNAKLKIAFHVFADNKISHEEYEKYRRLAKKYNTCITFYEIDNSVFAGLDDREFTIAAYYRFIIPHQLKDEASCFLYLDADITCLNVLTPFLDIDLTDFAACAVEDFSLDGTGNPILVQKKDERYFNSGMMYINIHKWLDEKISEKCMELLREVNEKPEAKKKYGYEFRCFDQDALNIILKNKVKYLQPHYNFLTNISLKKNEKLRKIPENVILLHYHGFNKPWHEWCFHPLAGYFRKYWKMSPWADTSLVKNPVKYRQMRLYARYFFKKKELFTAGYWLLKSISKKYCKGKRKDK